MADFNEIEDVAAGMASYGFFDGLVRRYGMLNVLFWGALGIVVGIFLIIQAFVWMFNFDYKDAWIKVKPNDSLYASEQTVKDTGANIVSLYRLMRPTTADDIDKMKIAEWKKTKLKLQLDTTLKTNLMVMLPGVLYGDSMLKYKTGFIGTFIKKDSTAEDNGGFGKHWFALKPNFKLLRKNYYHGSLDLDDESAAKYVMADSIFYINAQEGKLKEIPMFIKKK